MVSGSDLGGSVRIPSNACGTAALKPTAGRIPLAGQGSDGGLVGVVGLYNTLGFMARTAAAIEECAAHLLAEDNVGKINRDARFVPIPWRHDLSQQQGRKLKIGWYDDDGNVEATPGQRRAVRDAARLLAEAGHDVVHFKPCLLKETNELYGQLICADSGRTTVELLADSPVDTLSLSLLWHAWTTPKWLAPIVALYSKMSSGFWSAGNESGTTYELWKLNAKRLDIIEEILRQWERQGVDVVLAPGFPYPAQLSGYSAWSIAGISYTSVYNLLNFPAGTVPVSKESEEDQKGLEHYPTSGDTDAVYKWITEGSRGAKGMPLNVQVIGRPWQEETVVRIMKELQETAARANQSQN